jgi:hypothetical protein
MKGKHEGAMTDTASDESVLYLLQDECPARGHRVADEVLMQDCLLHA